MSEHIWITSDTHLGHTNIIKYCARPYDSAEQMNKDIIQKWNSVVSPQDLVYHLGDFGFGSKADVTQWQHMLHGRIKLIKGNHDNHTNQWYRDCGFVEVYDRPILVQDFYLLSHAPLEFMNDYIPFANIYGHVHNDERWKPVTKHSYNACVDVNNFTPVLFDDIKSYLQNEDN